MSSVGPADMLANKLGWWAGPEQMSTGGLSWQLHIEAQLEKEATEVGYQTVIRFNSQELWISAVAVGKKANRD
jgi:hypothetical protein